MAEHLARRIGLEVEDAPALLEQLVEALLAPHRRRQRQQAVGALDAEAAQRMQEEREGDRPGVRADQEAAADGGVGELPVYQIDAVDDDDAVVEPLGGRDHHQGYSTRQLSIQIVLGGALSGQHDQIHVGERLGAQRVDEGRRAVEIRDPALIVGFEGQQAQVAPQVAPAAELVLELGSHQGRGAQQRDAIHGRSSIRCLAVATGVAPSRTVSPFSTSSR